MLPGVLQSPMAFTFQLRVRSFSSNSLFGSEPTAKTTESAGTVSLCPLNSTIAWALAAVHPLTRANTLNNTGYRVPLMHYSLIPQADYIELTAVPACAAPQTFCAVKMYPSGTPITEAKKFIYETVHNITGAVCPPLVVGVGFGGLFGTVGLLAREASMRPLDVRHPDPEIAKLEDELLDSINKLGIGHMNLGGDITALAVNIEVGHSHSPCFPVAVQIQCWCCRRVTVRMHEDGRVDQLR